MAQRRAASSTSITSEAGREKHENEPGATQSQPLSSLSPSLDSCFRRNDTALPAQPNRRSSTTRRPLLQHICILVLLLIALPVQAAFEVLPGKRPTALGGAIVASGGDPMGFYINPASIAWGTMTSIETYYMKPFYGLEGDDLSRIALGGYHSFGDWGSVAIGHDQFAGDLYREDRTLLTYGRRITMGERLFTMGLGLEFFSRKYAETKYTAIDPLFIEYGYSKRSLGIDIGMQMLISRRLSAGLAIRRINRPNQALEDGVKDPLPRELQLGMAFRFDGFVLYTDLEYRDRPLNGADVTPRVGLEVPLFSNAMHLRAGGNRDELTFGFALNVWTYDSEESYMSKAEEGGVRERRRDMKNAKLRVGYTFRYPIGGVTGTLGHHMLGVDFYLDQKRTVLERVQTPRPVQVPQVIVEKDTVLVDRPVLVHEIVEDTSKVQLLQAQVSELETKLSNLVNMNVAIREVEIAQRLFLQKRYQDALEACNRATNLVPTLALAWVQKGSIYYAMGRYGDARTAWNRALRLDPQRDDVRQYLQQLPE